MDSPFFSNRQWYNGSPVYEPTRFTNRRPKSGSRVVQIPVQFVGSKPVATPSEHALKIQKIFRGFVIRKNVKKIKDVKLRVDEIEAKLSRSDVIKLIRNDDRERLRMNETLMSLLFQLDSIRGLDLGVRVLRKGVTRKAIALQDKIDSVVNCVSAELNDEDDLGENADSTEFCENLVDSCMEVEGSDGEIGVTDVGVDCEVKISDQVECNSDEIGFEENMEVEEDDNGEIGITNIGVDCDKNLCSIEDGKVHDEMDKIEVENDGKRIDGKFDDSDLFDRIVKDNENMMKMMMELVDRNEKQTKVMNALTRRVELLEKAFVCDMLTRKKKKKVGNDDACREE